MITYEDLRRFLRGTATLIPSSWGREGEQLTSCVLFRFDRITRYYITDIAYGTKFQTECMCHIYVYMIMSATIQADISRRWTLALGIAS